MTHPESHDAARHCASLFAAYDPVGIQQAYDDEDEYVLLLANCTCGSTICRTVRKGCDEALQFARRVEAKAFAAALSEPWHCYATGPEHDDIGSTCLLVEGHDGPHRYTRDDEGATP